MRTNHDLERYLAREILNKTLPRKPPAKERRGPERDAEYRAWIRTMPSLVSGQYGCECCHFGTDGGMGQKSSDYSCGPLTPEEHREYHQIGKRAFAAPTPTALSERGSTSMQTLTTTEGWFVRINYDDGDVRDNRSRNERDAHDQARQGSLDLKAAVDVCHGATVIATYRAGKLV